MALLEAGELWIGIAIVVIMARVMIHSIVYAHFWNEPDLTIVTNATVIGSDARQLSGQVES